MGYLNSTFGVLLGHNADSSEFVRLWCKKIKDDNGKSVQVEDIEEDEGYTFILYPDIITEGGDDQFELSGSDFICGCLPIMYFIGHTSVQIRTLLCFAGIVLSTVEYNRGQVDLDVFVYLHLTLFPKLIREGRLDENSAKFTLKTNCCS